MAVSGGGGYTHYEDEAGEKFRNDDADVWAFGDRMNDGVGNLEGMGGWGAVASLRGRQDGGRGVSEPQALTRAG